MRRILVYVVFSVLRTNPCLTEVVYIVFSLRYVVGEVTPARPADHVCRQCYTMCRVFFQSACLKLLNGGGGAGGRAGGGGRSGKAGAAGGANKRDNRDPARFKAGQPLENKGTCKHYSRSYRWLRFPCCGIAFPCDLCHELSDRCDDVTGAWAGRMICGYCR